VKPILPRRLAQLTLRSPWLGPFVALVAVYLLFVILRPDTFARPINLVTMARQTVIVAIAAVGMTMIIVQGGIDLSVGSTVALTTVVVAARLKDGAGPIPAAMTGVLVATACGAIIGLLVTGLRVAPFIVTLGAMSIIRGLAKGIAKEQKIDAPARGLDALMAPLSPGKAWLLFPPGVWIALALAVLVALVLRYTRFGRHVFAIGSNEQTARLCGVQVDRTRVLVYALAAGLTGIAGVLQFSTLTVGDPTDSFGLELEVIAAVVIGGASLSGGEGSILGALIGAFLMTVIKTGATYVGLPNWVQEIFTGAIILVAAALDRFRQKSR
jgi:ribose/xylose/arabinose/galactoside ABC-type transport system permease subunit